MSTEIQRKSTPILRKSVNAVLMLASLIALAGCYYSPYGYYGYPAYAYAPAPVVGGVFVGGGYGYRRHYWR